MDFFLTEYAGQPIWLWLAFLSVIGFLLWLDLGVVNRKDGVVSPAKSALMWAGFASLAMAFGAYVYFVYEPDAAFYLSADNLNQHAAIQFFTLFSGCIPAQVEDGTSRCARDDGARVAMLSDQRPTTSVHIQLMARTLYPEEKKKKPRENPGLREGKLPWIS